VSAENVETVRRGLEAYARTGFEGILELLHPDFTIVVPPELSAEPDTYVGHEGAGRYFAGFDGLTDGRLEPAEIIDAGPDTVITRLHLRATGRESGIEVDQESVQVWTLRDGQLARAEAFADMESARAAADL
jgi:ketosteroid isomerase-like protein